MSIFLLLSQQSSSFWFVSGSFYVLPNNRGAFSHLDCSVLLWFVCHVAFHKCSKTPLGLSWDLLVSGNTFVLYYLTSTDSLVLELCPNSCFGGLCNSLLCVCEVTSTRTNVAVTVFKVQVKECIGDVGKQFSANNHLNMYNTYCRPYKIFY